MRNVVLCGFMGSGKSSVGASLAALVRARFVDMDRAIEKKEGRRVSAIFEEDGEAAFRAMETGLARELAGQKGLIISTGGGTVLRAENVHAFREAGCTIVLLDVPLHVVQRRLRGDRSRPLLTVPDRANVMRRMYQERMPVYRAAADLVVENRGNIPVPQMARRVRRAVLDFEHSGRVPAAGQPHASGQPASGQPPASGRPARADGAAPPGRGGRKMP